MTRGEMFLYGGYASVLFGVLTVIAVMISAAIRSKKVAATKVEHDNEVSSMVSRYTQFMNATPEPMVMDEGATVMAKPYEDEDVTVMAKPYEDEDATVMAKPYEGEDVTVMAKPYEDEDATMMAKPYEDEDATVFVNPYDDKD